jgi:hypothetical protein
MPGSSLVVPGAGNTRRTSVPLWPFGKRGADAGVPIVPPFSADEIRTGILQQLPGHRVLFDGPFPITNDQGRFLCKGCGIAYDEFALTGALDAIRRALATPQGSLQILHVRCSKCGATSVFSPKNVMTLQPDDSLGPWSRRAIETARMSLTFVLKFSPAEAAAIPSERLATVLNLYRK